MDSGGFDPSNAFIAPDFKRRQLLFDSFSKLQQKSLGESTAATTLTVAAANTGGATSATAAASNSSSTNKLSINTTQTQQPQQQQQATSTSNTAAGNPGNTQKDSDNSSSGVSFSPSPSHASNLLVSDNAAGTLLYGWGAGYHGQLGLNTARKKCRLTPSCIDFHEAVCMVACGGFHTAVLTDDGRVFTWGDGRLGQLGNLARKHNMHSTPRLVDYLVSYKVSIAYLACGQYHTAAVSNTGRLYTWGSGKWGQLGHGVRQDERFPRKVETEKSLGNFLRVACGDRHTAGLNEAGGIVTFGNGQHGQLGHGNGLDCLRPTLLSQGELAQHRITGLDCGATTTAAVTEDGQLYLWGFGESLHPKGVSNVLESPRLVKVKDSVKQVACGLGHVLVLTNTGDVYAFGVASMGQIGHGTKNNVRNPRLILRGKEIYQIAAGRYHSMAVSLYGIVYSWGCSESGQTGANVNLENEYLPRIIDTLLPNVVGHISCGEHHSLALTSISHANVSHDVLHWKMIEDSELALKKQLLKETPNGLKTKHILMIEAQRETIIKALAETLKKEKEEKQKAAKEKIQLIQKTEQLMEQIQASIKKRSLEAQQQSSTTSAAVAALEENGLLGDEHSESSFSDLNIKQVEATALRLAASGMTQESKESHMDDGDEDEEEESAAKRKRAKRLQQLMEMRSGSGSASVSRNRSPNRSPSNLTPREQSSIEHEQEEKEQTVNNGVSNNSNTIIPVTDGSRPSSVTNTRVRFPPIHSTNQTEEQTINNTGLNAGSLQTQQASGSSSALVLSSSSVSHSPSHANSSSNEVGFAPLAPRIAFIEQTTKTLSRVKAFMSNTVIAAEGNYLSDLIRVKKNYNALKAERQRLEKHHKSITHELSLCQPNHDEQQSATIAAEQLKQLNMKLVTLNTRLMEAEENKKNYELYIIRMKEEDLQLGKQIDHLRSICAEYTRLLHKLQKMNIRVDQQRMEVLEETHSFVNDVTQFMGFADTVVKDYRRVLNNSYKQSCYQEQLFHQRQQRVETKRREKIEALKDQFLSLQQQQSCVSSEIDGWEEKVEYYEKRFRKVAAATGLTRAEQIISKFYFNDEITQDLHREIQDKEQQLATLSAVKQQLSSQLRDSAALVSISKWKDVNEAEEKNAEAKLQNSRQTQEYEKWTNRLTQVLEGMQQLNNKIQQAVKQTQNTQEQQEEQKEQEQDTETDTSAFLSSSASSYLSADADIPASSSLSVDDDVPSSSSNPPAGDVPLPTTQSSDDSDSDDDGSAVVDVSRLLNEVAISTAANIAALSTPDTNLPTASPAALSAASPSKQKAVIPRYTTQYRQRHGHTLSGATGFTEQSIRSLESNLVSGLSTLVHLVSSGASVARERALHRAAEAAEAAEAEQMAVRTEQLAALLLNPRKNIWEAVSERVEQATTIKEKHVTQVKSALGEGQ